MLFRVLLTNTYSETEVKVNNTRVTVLSGNQVCRLDVTMDDTSLVNMFETLMIIRVSSLYTHSGADT